VHPGHFLILVAGDVACVEEAYEAGLESGTETLLDRLFLPAVHPDVVRALRGRRGARSGEALGMIETRTVAATIGAADCGLKGAGVSLLEIRLADRIGGKGYCAFSGPLAEVEAAVEAAVERLASPETLIAHVVIPQFHEEMLANIEAGSEFWTRLQQEVG
jgi:microcompartment protein CcmL/EutN